MKNSNASPKKTIEVSLSLMALSLVSMGNAFAKEKPVVAPAKESTSQGKEASSDSSARSSSSGEAWKGEPIAREFGIGFLAGAALIEPKYGFGLVGTASKKILNQGFVPDINNQVFVELESGPFFVSGNTPFFLGTHLRWDFIKDEKWAFYALGGFGIQVTGRELGDRSLVFVRTGAGAFYFIQENMSLRLEASHELIGAGLSFDF